MFAAETESGCDSHIGIGHPMQVQTGRVSGPHILHNCTCETRLELCIYGQSEADVVENRQDTRSHRGHVCFVQRRRLTLALVYTYHHKASNPCLIMTVHLMSCTCPRFT